MRPMTKRPPITRPSRWALLLGLATLPAAWGCAADVGREDDWEQEASSEAASADPAQDGSDATDDKASVRDTTQVLLYWVNYFRTQPGGVFCKQTNRRYGPVKPLTGNLTVAKIGKARSAHLARYNDWAHRLSETGAAIRQRGIRWNGIAENLLANGSSRPYDAVMWWLNSTTGHCEILMEPGWEIVAGGNTFVDRTYYWSLLFVSQP